jgi:hypothetical protein
VILVVVIFAARWPVSGVMVPEGHDNLTAFGRCRRVHGPVGGPGRGAGASRGRVSRAAGAW